MSLRVPVLTGSLRNLVRDVVPVLALAVVDVLQWRAARDVPPWWVGTLIMALPLATATLRHRWPVPAFAATTLGAVVAFLAVPSASEFVTAAALAVVLCLVTIVDRGSRSAVLLAVAVSAIVSAATVLRPEPVSGSPVATLAALTVAAVLWGRNRKARRTELTLLRERAETAEQTRDALARTAVAEERRRIAREVHDIVSHNIAVMTNLADGAAVALRRNGPAARTTAAVEAIAGTGREAMHEMHALLGVLREPEGEEDAPRRPAPGMGQLPDLVEQVRTAGLGVSLRSQGSPVPVGGGTALTIYRLVQESLSNTLRHGSGATAASVTLTWDTDQVEVDVVDDGRPLPRPPAEHPSSLRGGHGLIGMRERVQAHGGDLCTGPDGVSGWRVRARLPITTHPRSNGEPG